MNEQVTNIEEFISEFDNYYGKFIEFFNAYYSETNKYYLGHPKLIEASYRLQAKYIFLPKLLRKRLLDVEFDVFLHCHNIVDFYSLRQYIVDNNLFHTVASMVERVDGEVKTALEIYKIGGDKDYSRLPRRNYDFFREWDQVKIIKKEQIDTNQEHEKNEVSSQAAETEAKVINYGAKDNEEAAQKDLLSKLNKANETLESVEKAGNTAKDIFEAGLGIVSLIAKYILKFD